MLLFVDNLTNVDFSYLHPERGLLGETWLASVRLEGELDHQGMVCDFGEVKRLLRRFLDERIDHCLLVPSRSPNLKLHQAGSQIQLDWQFGDQQLRCSSPAQAIALIDAEQISPPSVASWCIGQLKSAFGPGVKHIELDFQQESIDSAAYHYSHGLKKHAGNCQRIAHGHRSRIHIWRDGTPATDLEQDWATRWQDIYLGSREDLVGQDDLLEFRYQAQQGAFRLSLPPAVCYLMDTDTTVEWLAVHIAQTLAAEHPGQTIRVQAFEGLHKGAIAEARQD